MHITEPAPPVKSMNGTVPARLAEVIDRCLAKNPDARIANGEALAEAIADAQVTRREIAPSVREFLTAARGATAQATVLGMMWWALLEALPRIEQSAILGNPLDAIFFLLAGITPIIFIRPFYAARGVIRAGLDQRDVANAAASSATETDANVEYELARTERLANKLSKIWWRAGFLIMGAAMVPIVAEALTDVVAFGFPLWMLVHASFPVGALVFTLAMALAPRRFIAIITRGTPESGRLWHAFWAGSIGRWLFKIAGIGVKRGRPLSLPETAPTEVLLGRAADELYAQLPTAQRKRLGDMRDVIRRLEAAAGTLRERRDELATAIADIGEPEAMPKRGALVAELRSEQSAVEARMAAAVGGLETLRLDLLRLRAGVGHPDDLTAAIEEARAVGDAVNVELAAYDEVEALTVQSNKRSDS